MPIRTTAEAVGLIIEVDESISLVPFIETASALVDDVLAGDTEAALSSARLELIERWLAAHFYAIRDPRTTSEKAGSVSASYQSKVDLGLNVTHYGQQAMMLDTTGALRALGKGKKRASVKWLGRTNEERLLDPIE